MKKLFITAAIATMFSVTAFADGGKKAKAEGEKNVSYTALNKFSAEFESASNVVWTVTPNTQKVDFVFEGAKFTAFYDLDGEYLGRTQEVSVLLLPETDRKELTAKYADYTVSRVIQYENKSAEPLVYFVDLVKANKEIVLKAVPNEGLTFFQAIK
ncbi:hypothetical protein ACFQZS_02020 [Mucilaginibacter calamicampi]|uniref:Beta-lactamase-inhibitor-like PepSY-like domain-containing protein n=1 Tax=Mucilaginibacter calamicampi TaxID=1302352 RepID=A0ABW2YSR7_9SPHI